MERQKLRLFATVSERPADSDACCYLDLGSQLFVVANEDMLLSMAGQGGQHMRLQHLSRLLAHHYLQADASREPSGHGKVERVRMHLSGDALCRQNCSITLLRTLTPRGAMRLWCMATPDVVAPITLAPLSTCTQQQTEFLRHAGRSAGTSLVHQYVQG